MEEKKEGQDLWGSLKKIEIKRIGEEEKVFLRGQPYMMWDICDSTGRKMAVVELYELGLATKEELAEAFEVDVKTVYNYAAAFRAGGIKGLIEQAKGPKESWKVVSETKGKILWIFLKEGIKNLTDIQVRLKEVWKKEISVESIRQILIENGFTKGGVEKEHVVNENNKWDELFGNSLNKGQMELCFEEKKEEEYFNAGEIFDKETSSAEEIAAKKTAAVYSRAQRIYLDELEQSLGEFTIEKGKYSAYVGGLLFTPLLKRYNFITTVRRMIRIKTQEGYSLEELSKTLFYYDVFGFNSIENFKTVYSEEFGILIGKSNSPSIYTLRRFMEKVREQNIGEKLMEEFGKEYLKSGLVKWGVLYIDEHFLPYHGIQMITMGWFTVRNKAIKGGYNFMAIDEEYNPFIFFIRPSSEDLVKKIPELIKKAREIGKKSGIVDDKLVVIFDREGYSAELFRGLSDEKSESYVQFISWAKYADTWVNDFKDEEFSNIMMLKYKIQDSEKVEYFETERQMSKYGKIRAIVIMSGRKKQRTAIYTNDRERSAKEIINLICTRWGQENLFKALKINHCVDYFPGKGLYDSDEIEEQPMVDNHEIKMLKQEKTVLMNKLNKLKVRMANKILALREEKINWEEMKKEEIEMISDIAGTESAITVINAKIGKLPEEIKFDEAHDGRKLYELDYEKKRFLDNIKIFSYHMQKQMCEMLINYYDNRKEIWPAMRMIINRGGTVRLQKGKLMVRLKRFSDPEIDYAARHLCEDLNKMVPVTMDRFKLPMRYEVA